MSTFLNVYFNEKTPQKFIWKHFLFSFLWLIGIAVFLLRVDVYTVKLIAPEFQWIVGVLPLALLVSFIVIILSQKWYYSLAALFYPFLVIFWFFPKMILNKGKIYLFLKYANYIYLKFKDFKKTIIRYSVFVITLLIIALSGHSYAKVFGICMMSFFYLRFVVKYLKTSFTPAQMFGDNIQASLSIYLEEIDIRQQKFIEQITSEASKDQKLTEEEQKVKKLKSLIIWNYGLNYIDKSLNGFKAQSAITSSLLLQQILFFLVSVLFFTFVNFQLFYIDHDNFLIKGNPSVFGFTYYTLKTITFGDIESLKPNSMIAKCFEIASFLVIGLLIVVLFFSIIFSLRQTKVKENIKLTSKIFKAQNQYIVKHVEDEFGLTIQAALKEFADIKKSIDNLKGIIDRLF